MQYDHVHAYQTRILTITERTARAGTWDHRIPEADACAQVL